jgi:hypothetical protein
VRWSIVVKEKSSLFLHYLGRFLLTASQGDERCQCNVSGKVQPITGLVAYRGSRGIALLILNLGARRGWVISTTPRPLYPRERPGTHCTEGWVVPRAGLDVCEKSLTHRDSIPGPSSPNSVNAHF